MSTNPTGREAVGGELLPVQSSKHKDVEPIVGQLQSQLRVLQLERTAIAQRIGTIRKTIAGLADLFGSDVLRWYLSLLAANCGEICIVMLFVSWKKCAVCLFHGTNTSLKSTSVLFSGTTVRPRGIGCDGVSPRQANHSHSVTSIQLLWRVVCGC